MNCIFSIENRTKGKMMFFDLAIFDEFRRMDKRQVLYQFLNFAMIVSSALMIWKGNKKKPKGFRIKKLTRK